ncbi:MAG: sigma 54-interacting transcriptional regulator, partial [bacterium]
MKRVIVVDDDKSFLKSIGMILSRNGFDVIKSVNGTEALQLIHENVDDIVAVVTDLSMPGGVDGIDILEKVKGFGRDIPVILITAYGNIEIAVDAMRKGAFTFLAKPINFKVLIAQLKKAVRTADIIQQNKVLRKEIDTIEKDKYGLVYNSESMRKLVDSASEIAKTDETVLISGESGTGKELFARLILRNSLRKLSKFVAFNASAVSDTLMDAELFGHKRGAFTGAHADKPGYIGEAEGGTLFIDEIGDMPFELQAKLLRFL